MAEGAVALEKLVSPIGDTKNARVTSKYGRPTERPLFRANKRTRLIHG